MTWKSYTAVSGATVLAGWLASAPPANTPASSAPVVRPPRGAAVTPAADIQEQAARLQARLQAHRDYVPPQRNLFRFEAAEAVDSGYGDRTTTFEPQRDAEPEPIVVAPPLPALTLSGIAEDYANGEVMRTAVVSAPSGVELVREGGLVAGYRVSRIESEAVELVSVADGSTRRLTLKR